MNKLTKKFVFGVGLILIFTLILSITMNLCLIERFYVYQKKRELGGICGELETRLAAGEPAETVIEDLEEVEKVAAVHLEPESDFDLLNETLRENFRQKGIGFQKFWLWDQDYLSAIEHGKRLRIYHQEKLNYSLMVEYMQLESGFFAVAMIIPDISEAIRIMNIGTAVIAAGTLTLACFLMVILVKRITGPLNELKLFAGRISDQTFVPLNIQTGDELETVAQSMNVMGETIETYQKELENRNKIMEELLDDVAHELKTPIALIRVYAQGIKDGVDDGSFLDTILQKNRQMGNLIERLLTLSRIGQGELKQETILLDQVIQQVISDQKTFCGSCPLEFQTEIAPGLAISGDREAVSVIISNLISNAVKYADSNTVTVSLKEIQDDVQFQVRNHTGYPLDTQRIWDAFYVGEESRNKDLSGTGLGLPIVKKYASRCGYPIEVVQSEGQVVFTVLFRKNDTRSDRKGE